MPAGSTYTPIATTTASSGTSVTFSSIPSTYTDLVLVVNGLGTEATGVTLQFNSDTGSNYSYTSLSGNGSSASSSRVSSYTLINAGVFHTSQAANIINIMNYANTTTYKTVISRGSAASWEAKAVVGLWRSTSAISSIKVACSNFQPTSYLTLYGIASA